MISIRYRSRGLRVRQTARCLESLTRLSPHLPELRKGVDQPQRRALEAAGEKGDPGRDQKHANRLLDFSELLFHGGRGAHERADRGGGGDEGEAEAEAVDGE